MICLKNFSLLGKIASLLLILCISNRATFAQEKEAKQYQQRVVCYWGSWSVYRPGNGKFEAMHVDPSLCTHIIYSFTGVDATSNQMVLLDPYNDVYESWGKGSMEKLVEYKAAYPDLKVLIACGGWNEGTSKFTQMAATAENRTAFIDSVCWFVEYYGLDGFDLDWEYPVATGAQNGSPQDYDNFIFLLKELRIAFDKLPKYYLLTAAVAAGREKIDAAYNVAEMAKYLDLINVMTYDFHGQWDNYAHCNAPLYPSSQDFGNNLELTVDFAMRYYLAKGARPDQLVLGVPFYGQGYTMKDRNNVGLYAPITGGSSAGPYTGQMGMLGFNEICNDTTWTSYYDDEMKTMYAIKDNGQVAQWVGFDNADTIRTKCEYMKDQGLGGIMVWSIETDDFRGLCGGGKYPLLRSINDALGRTEPLPSTQPPTTQNPQQTDPAGNASVTVSTTTTTTTTQTSDPGAEFKCPSEGLFPHPDCCMYYHCSPQLYPYVHPCNPGLHFNSLYKVCDWPASANCATSWSSPACPARDKW